jgi:hypothetical protein
VDAALVRAAGRSAHPRLTRVPSPPPIPTPALCRLCRRPLVAAAVTCPACGARQSLGDRAWGREPRPQWRGWRIAAGVILLVVLVAAAMVWLSVLREIKGPISSRPSSSECADLASELANRSAADQRLTSEMRDRIRQCFERR